MFIKNKKSKMKQKSYVPNGDNEKAAWMINFDEKFPAYATKFGYSDEVVAASHHDRLAFSYGLMMVEAAKTFEHQSVNYKDDIRNGTETNLVTDIPVFTPPANPPIAVAPGIFRRVSKIVNSLKSNALYTEAVGKDLGIIGADYLGKDNPEDIQVKLTAKQTGGTVKLKYTKGDIDGIKLESKRGTETEFTLLDKVTQTTYTDVRAMLVAGVPEIRQYRAWCIVKDKIVGQVSDVVSVTVTPV